MPTGRYPALAGLLVLEKRGANHTIAVTLWEDETALVASAEHADRFAVRIGEHQQDTSALIFAE